MGVHPGLRPLRGLLDSESRAESCQVPPCWDSGQGKGLETQNHVESRQARTRWVLASLCLLCFPPPAPHHPSRDIFCLDWLLRGGADQKARFLDSQPEISGKVTPQPLPIILPESPCLSPSHPAPHHLMNQPGTFLVISAGVVPA